MKAHFSNYGLPLEVSADHPLLLDSIVQDLQFFRAPEPSTSNKSVSLFLKAQPFSSNGQEHPGPAASFQESIQSSFPGRHEILTRYWRNPLVVMSHLAKRRIQVRVPAEETSLLPDPLYHISFTQPLSPWLKRLGLFFLHAGCVAEGGKGLLIVGPPHSGKTVLSICAIRGGFKFLGDEQPLLRLKRGRLQVLLFPRRIRLDPLQLRFFPEIASKRIFPLAEKILFSAQELWPGCLGSSCTPRVLIFPKFRERGRLRCSTLESHSALAHLLQDDHFVWYRNNPWRRISQEHLDLLGRLASETRGYRLDYRGQDLPRIPSLFRELLS